MSTKKKVIAVAVTTIALTAGSFGLADAATSKKVTKTSFTSVSNVGLPGKPDHVAELSTLLSTLVAKGTITQAQADAIIAVAQAAEAAEPARGPRDGLKGPFGDKLTIIASTLGTDTATVITRLQAGDTLATIAGAKKDALIAALVADETKKIDAAVTAGKLTAADATTLKAGLTAHVTAEVNATAPVGGFKGGRGHGHGPDGDNDGPRGPMMGGKAPAFPTPSAPAN